LAHHDDTEPTAESRQRGMIPREDLPFLPRVRWRVWIPLLSVLAIFVGAYFVSEARRANRLRDQLRREHAVLTESLAPPYRALRERLDRLTFSAIGPWQGTYTAPGFRFEELAREPALYGRVRLGEIHRAEDVEPSILHRYPDQLASCLGIEFNLVRELYTKGDFLMPKYIDSVQSVQSGDRLAVLRQDLQFRLRRDTPDIVQWSRRPYFVLAVDEGASSIDGPTRLYIWDLRNDQIVFRSRDEGNDTVIIPVRIAGMPGGGRPVPAPSAQLTLSQHDCAVANVARQQLGVQTLDLRHAPAPPPSPVGDAGAPSTAAAVGATPAADAAP
jgi:hypothetical protein